MSSHYVYVIVNKINLKLYFGSHSWENEGVDPTYYGSGKIIKQAVKKYGKDNFIVYPIKFYNNAEECRKAEEELLTKYDVANNPYCYNIKNGAIGWTSEDITGENNPMYGKNLSEEHRKKLSQANKGEKHPQYGKRGRDSHNYGRHHTVETRRKLSKAKNDKKIPVVAIHKDTGKIRVFESQKECARQLNLNKSDIYNCLKGRQKSAGGYTYKKINRDKRVFKVSPRSKAYINRLKGIRKQTKGYTFKYIEELDSGIYEGML